MNTVTAIIVDPNGYICLCFKDWDARSAFMKCIPSGDPYGKCRPSDDGKMLAWRLADMTNAFTIQDNPA